MAEPFKNRVDHDLVRAMADHLRRADPGFDAPRFLRAATRGLDELELKARVRHVAGALAAALPADFARAADAIERSLQPARDDTELGALVTDHRGLAGFAIWPLGEFVAARGLVEPERALSALHALTQRWTAEFAIRPFLVEHRQRTFAALRRWAGDPSAHVRRLVSEGSRPRLPWGMQLGFLIADPSPTLPLLERLQDDDSDYVRRSVANHLNDIAKDHPHVVAEWVERHLPGASPQRAALLRHACRTLVKRGDRRVLEAFGVGAPYRGEAALRLLPRRCAVGGAVELRVDLVSAAARPQPLVADYRVHYRKADGGTSPKVRKGWKLVLAPGERRALTKTLSLAPVSTRRLYAGRHAIELLVNGAVVAAASFTLCAERG
ncbi:MAG: DNA alkylation repair protein [Planctomycetota bacterium]